MPGLSVVFHLGVGEEAQAAQQWYKARNQSAADSFLADLTAASKPSLLLPNAGRCLCTELAVISFIGFPSSWSTGW